MDRDHSARRWMTVALAAAMMLGPAVPAAAFSAGSPSPSNPSDPATAGAGIGGGGGSGGTSGNITINGGTIDATGGNTGAGAGIGGGGTGGTGGNITINGGTIDATGGNTGAGAGIGGGGTGGTGGNITINGGTIDASGGNVTQLDGSGAEPPGAADPQEGQQEGQDVAAAARQAAAGAHQQAGGAAPEGSEAAMTANEQAFGVEQAAPQVWADSAPTATAAAGELAPVKWGEVPEDLWMYLMVAKGWRGIPGDGRNAIYPPGTPGAVEAGQLPESVFVHTVTPGEVPVHIWHYLLREGWRDVAGDGAVMIYPPEFFN